MVHIEANQITLDYDDSLRIYVCELMTHLGSLEEVKEAIILHSVRGLKSGRDSAKVVATACDAWSLALELAGVSRE